MRKFLTTAFLVLTALIAFPQAMTFNDVAFIGSAGSKPAAPSGLRGLVYKLDADVGVTQIAGIVSQWDDQSGSGKHATATLGNRPTLVSSAVNGHAIVRFDGVTTWMDAGASHTDWIGSMDVDHGIEEITVYLLIKTDNSGSFNNRTFSTDTDHAGYLGTYLPFSDGNCYWDTADENSGGGGRVAAAVDTSSYCVVTLLRRTDGTAQIRVNGTDMLMGADSFGDTSTTTPTEMYLGAYGPGTQDFLKGDIQEMDVCNVGHSDGEMAAEETILKAKGGIP